MLTDEGRTRCEKLHAIHNERLEQYVNHRLYGCHPDMVKDTVQNVWMGVIATLDPDPFTIPEDFAVERAFILALAKHKVADHFRKEHRINTVPLENDG